MESLKQVTRSTAKARAAIAKVKRATAPTTSTGEDGEVRPSITQKSAVAPSDIHLLGVNTCFRFLEDSIPSKVKEGLA